MKQAFVSWSGGKDCCLACQRAITSGLNVRYLVNMVTEDGQRSRSHGLAAKWLQMQSQAMGIPLVQRQTTHSTYEAEFKRAIRDLKLEGITAGVFGDIDFNAHLEWIERVCSAAGIKPYLPLWEEDQTELLREFIDAGFKAVVVATRADRLGEEWLGQVIDHAFLADLAKLPNITPCGESGEYHTLVIDGPLFQKSIEITAGDKVLRDGRWFLDIVECELR
ncbi:MAG: diphthine--ammonia ligase [Dehalococcoidales bacterium]|nr:diphthine--ammonia ligase [Dehalococcoidales bacterium]